MGIFKNIKIKKQAKGVTPKTTVTAQLDVLCAAAVKGIDEIVATDACTRGTLVETLTRIHCVTRR